MGIVIRWRQDISPKDDAMHPSDSPERWEWWYFDADLENGYQVIGTYHIGSPRPPAYPDARFIEIAIYDPDGDKRFVRKAFALKESFASAEVFDVNFGGAYCKGTLDKTHWFFNEPDKQGRQQGCDLTFEAMVEPYLPLKERGADSEDWESKTSWFVAHARAKVTGAMTWDGQTIDVKGEGYHDHNWSETPMSGTQGNQDVMWGRIYSGDWTLSCIGGMGRRHLGKKPFGELMAFKKDKLVAVTKEGGGIGSEYTDEETGALYPLKQKMFYKEPGIVEGEVMFKQKHILHFMDLQRRFKPFHKWHAAIYEGKPAYFRFRQEYEADLLINGESVKSSGKCWSEYHKFV